jgi:hypothetical protein
LTASVVAFEVFIPAITASQRTMIPRIGVMRPAKRPNKALLNFAESLPPLPAFCVAVSGSMIEIFVPKKSTLPV